MATTKIYPITSTDSYARIKNRRLLVVIRAGGVVLFAAMVIVALFAIPLNYQSWTAYMARASEPTRVAVAQFGLTPSAVISYLHILDLSFAISFCIVGLIIFLKRTDDWVADLMDIFLFSQGFGPIFAVTSITSQWLWLSVILTTLILGSIFALLCLFPNGKIYPLWMRWLLLPYLPVLALSVYNRYFLRVSLVGTLTYLVMVTFWAVGIYAQFQRLRHTESAVQRQQTKRIITGGAIAVAGAGLASIFNALATPGPTGLLNTLVIQPLFLYGGLLIFLLMAAFSILRYRLWEIDLVVNRGLVYGGLTVGLAIIFVGVVLLLQTLLQTLFGSGQTTLAAVVSVGVVVVLFNPIRQRLQWLVDKYLFGLRPDLTQKTMSEKRTSVPISKPGAISGKMLGSYRAADLLGRGGMGEVYRGYQPALNRSVAIKVLSAHLATESEFRLRFEREAHALAGLHHPNIVSIFDYGEADGVYYMVMEHIDGRELSAILRERHALPLSEAIPIIRDIANALDYAHEQNMIHRDVKPSNIMLRTVSGQKKQAILMDFGLIKLTDSSTRITQSGTIGTLSYMAPEQIMTGRPLDHRADIYSLGITAYQMVTGHLPFDSDNPAQVAFAHVQQPPPDPRTLQPDLPEAVAQAILRALAKLPQDRPQSAGEFAAALVVVDAIPA